MNTFIIVNIIFGLLGLFIAYKIKTNKALKKQGKQMVCLVGHKCDDVVFSDYSTFLGLNLEIMGFVYYAAIALFYIIYLLIPSAITELILFASLGITFGGFLFSIYLTYIQVFKLKSLCSWCLSSALASTIIFFSSYSLILSSRPDLIVYISEIQNFIMIFEFISLILGIGIFTVLEITTFKFLKDFQITLHEKAVLKNISQFGWFVLFLFILNNVGLYLPARFLNEISQNPVTLLEVVFIILIVINAIINQTQVLPEIHTKSLKPSTMPVARISKLRKIATAQSVISLFLWYGLFYINFMM
jgi:uncharacterized membrane protein